MIRHLRSYISLLLSFVLAFAPTVSFAQNDSAAKAQRFDAISTQAYQKRLTRSKSELTKAVRPSVVESAAAASNATPRYMTGGEALRTFFPPVTSSRGKSLIVIQEPGVKGRAKRQIVRGANFEQILLDEFGNGTASKVAITRGPVTVTASNPLGGKYTKMVVEDRRREAVFKTKFYMNNDAQTYRVARIEVLPYKVDHYTFSTPIGNMQCLRDVLGSNGDLTTSMGQFEKLLEQFKEKAPVEREEAMKCKLQRLQNFLFDSSCHDGVFADSLDPMLSALARIMVSRGTNNPGYLQCIEDRGYALNSAKLQGTLMKKINAITDLLKATGKAENEIYDDSCTPLQASFKSPIAGQINLGRDTALFKCDATMPKAGSTEGSLITIGATKDNVATAIGHKRMKDPVKGYAELMTHELLHTTGLSENPDEDLVHDIQKCCADPSYGETSNKKDPAGQACAKLDERANDDYLAQQTETLLSGMPQYDGLESAALKTFGSDRSDDFMRHYLSDFSKDKKMGESIAKFRECYADARGDQAKQAECAIPMNERMLKFTDNFVHDKCPSYADGARSGDKNCEDLRKSFGDAIRAQLIPVRTGIAPSMQVYGAPGVALGSAAVALATTELNGGTNSGPTVALAKTDLWTRLATGVDARDTYARTSGLAGTSRDVRSDNSATQKKRVVASPKPAGQVADYDAFSGLNQETSKKRINTMAGVPAPKPKSMASGAAATVNGAGVTVGSTAVADGRQSTTEPKKTSSTSLATAGVAGIKKSGVALTSPKPAADSGWASDVAATAVPISAPAPAPAKVTTATDTAVPAVGIAATGVGVVSTAGKSVGSTVPTRTQPVSVDQRGGTPMPVYTASQAQPGVGGQAGRGDQLPDTNVDSPLAQNLNHFANAAATMASAVSSEAQAMGNSSLARALQPAAQSAAQTISAQGSLSGASLASYSPPPPPPPPPRRSIASASPSSTGDSNSGVSARSSSSKTSLAEKKKSDDRNSDEKKDTPDEEKNDGVPSPTELTKKPDDDLAPDAKVDQKKESIRPTPSTPERLAAIERSPVARSFPSGTSIIKELSSKNYSVTMQNLHSQEWWDLMSLRNVQVKLLNGSSLGASKPKFCMREIPNPSSFVTTQCGK